MFTSAEIRALGRESLRGNWLMAILVSLVSSIIMFIASWIDQTALFFIASLLISGPMTYGLASYFLQLFRRQQPKFSVLFTGFQFFGATILLNLLLFIFILLWSLLLFIPGIIAALRYSMSWYILYDNPGIKPIDAIRKSKEIMYGYKWKLVKLYLSFIGWFILSVITLGIGFLWYTPYVIASMSAFYEQVKDKTLSTSNHTVTI
jgi:uncharacterized membrane protein